MFETCACGSGTGYLACCGRLHNGAPATSAEALMRARYTAFSRGDATFLRSSWAPETRPATVDLDRMMVWTGLTIEEAETTGSDTATVQFAATWKRGEHEGVMRELGRFRFDGTTWLYIDGTMV